MLPTSQCDLPLSAIIPIHIVEVISPPYQTRHQRQLFFFPIIRTYRQRRQSIRGIVGCKRLARFLSSKFRTRDKSTLHVRFLRMLSSVFIIHFTRCGSLSLTGCLCYTWNLFCLIIIINIFYFILFYHNDSPVRQNL